MSEKWKEEGWAQDFWYSGKVTRRRIVGWGGGAIGALMLVPAPWQEAFGQAKPYKIGAIHPLSGAAGGLRESKSRTIPAQSIRLQARRPPVAKLRWSASRWPSIASTRQAA